MSEIDDAVTEIRRARARYTAARAAQAAALEQLQAACQYAREQEYPMQRIDIAKLAGVHPNTIGNWFQLTQKRRGEQIESALPAALIQIASSAATP